MRHVFLDAPKNDHLSSLSLSLSISITIEILGGEAVAAGAATLVTVAAAARPWIFSVMAGSIPVSEGAG